jgi:hypothetical protein
VKYIGRSNSPRLYMNLAKQVVLKLSNFSLKDENLKELIYMFNHLVDLEKVTYSRFDLLSIVAQEISNRRSQLSQADIIKVLEGTLNFRNPSFQVALAN